MLNGVDVDSVKETCDALLSNPKLGKSQFRIHNTWKKGSVNTAHVKGYYTAGEEMEHSGSFDFDADEPPALAGTDTGPNPVEYLLSALSGCMTTTIIYKAAMKGIKIRSLESDFEGDLDVRGFLDLDKDVPCGYQKIRVIFKVDMDEPVENLEGMYKFSPVYSMVSAAVPIEVEFEKI